LAKSYNHFLSNVDWLKGEFKSKKRDVGFVGETHEVVDYALYLLTEDLVFKLRYIYISPSKEKKIL
jgi:hypothetical protein